MKENINPVTSDIPEDRFERIGTTHYKIVRQPNAAGQLIERSIPWTIEAIQQDLFVNIWKLTRKVSSKTDILNIQFEPFRVAKNLSFIAKRVSQITTI